jgi:hypothetical protein
MTQRNKIKRVFYDEGIEHEKPNGSYITNRHYSSMIRVSYGLNIFINNFRHLFCCKLVEKYWCLGMYRDQDQTESLGIGQSRSHLASQSVPI